MEKRVEKKRYDMKWEEKIKQDEKGGRGGKGKRLTRSISETVADYHMEKPREKNTGKG